jgi:hypothetical protein
MNQVRKHCEEEDGQQHRGATNLVEEGFDVLLICSAGGAAA